MNITKDKMETHYDLDTLGKADVGKHFKAYKRTRGLQKNPTKVAISIRLDEDIVEAFKASGKGWQTMLNDILRESFMKDSRSVRDVIKET